MSLHAVCRICLATGVRVHSLSGTPLYELYEKLTNIAWLRSQRPAAACYVCFTQLQRCRKLAARAVRADNLLTKILRKEGRVTVESIRKIDRDRYNLNSLHASTTEVYNVDSVCNTENIKEEPSCQLKEEVLDEEVPYDIKQEVENKVDEGGMVVEGSWTGLNGSPDENDNGRTNDIRRVTTEGLQIATEELRIQNFEDSLEYCPQPDKFNVNPNHRATTELVFTCDSCGENFENKEELISHITDHNNQKEHDEKPKTQIEKSKHRPTSECTICHKQFYRNYMRIHLRTHSGKKPFQCEFCMKRFNQKGHLKLHIRIHTNTKQYQCNVCERRFIQRTTLNNHMNTHCNGNQYQCNKCEKKFKRKDYLTEHVKCSHENAVKLHKCALCGKAFSRRYNLNVHLKTHEDQRLFECGICYHRFAKKSDLKRHNKTHTGIKEFKCNMCPKRFTRKESLVQHVMTHTSEKPYECDTCHKRFRQRWYFTKHVLACSL